MEIPQQARKCPHCHHFQDRWSVLLFHPGITVLLASLPAIAIMIVISAMFDSGENYQTYKDQIVISDSQLVFGELKSGPTVDVMGTIKNTSAISWKEIDFHVDFFDAAGKRIDVGEKEHYSFYLPANGTSSFKISYPREFPDTNYVKGVVRVVTAKDASARWWDLEGVNWGRS